VIASLIGLGWWQHKPLIAAVGLVWLAHLALDRLMGYGLKYHDYFEHTHLSMIGKGDHPHDLRRTATREVR
jgi:hypothetical protein